MKTTRNLLLVGAMVVFCGSMANAQIIYSNAFNGGAVDIWGTAPDVANNFAGGTNTATWTDALGSNRTNGVLFADGTSTCPMSDSWILPFEPQPGHHYTLTAKLNFSGAVGSWLGMGFSQNVNSNVPDGYGTFADGAPYGGPQGWDWVIGLPSSVVQWFAGPRATPVAGLAAGNVMPTNGTYTWRVTLDTSSNQWVIACFINGIQFGADFQYPSNSNPNIHGCGITEHAQDLRITNVQWLTFSLACTETHAALPVISQQPTSRVVPLGAAYTNKVSAYADADGGPLHYRWYTNDVPLANGFRVSGAASNVLIVYPIQLSDNTTNLYVVVSNTYGAVTSSPVSLTVLATFPVRYTNPMTLFGGGIIGGTNYLGSSPTFSVSVVGALPLTYEWLTNGVVVADATNTSFTFTNCQMNSPTNFTCIVSNFYGTVTNSWSAVYIATPQAPYPQAVLADHPIAFWRMNEPDDGMGNQGITCHDYQSGNNGIYTNVYLGDPGYNVNEPSETAAFFGILTPSYVGQIQGVDFEAPAGHNAEFSVEAWVAGPAGTSGSPIITKGIYQVNDSFALNLDTTASHNYQFTVRAANGVDYLAASTVGADAQWHYLVGVCDEARTNISLYIDGALASSTYIPAEAGVLANDNPVTIGAGRSSATSGYDIQFTGDIDDVAVYNYALSPNQVHPSPLHLAPVFDPAPTNIVIIGTTVVIPAGAIGAAPLGYYWTNVSTGVFVAGGATNGVLLDATLTISNLPVNWYGDQLELIVTNAYGSTNAYVNLPYPSAPQITTDVQSPFGAPLGGTASNSIAAVGVQPFHYQWQYNGDNLSDNGHYAGSHTSRLNIFNTRFGDEGSYRVIVTNSSGSVTSSVATLIIVNNQPIGFNGNGVGWTANSAGAYTTSVITNGLLTLTDGGHNEARSFFLGSPLYIGAFKVSFTYEASGGDGGTNMADGATFCIQNSTNGAAALGGIGGSLGVGEDSPALAIVPSAELELHCYANSMGGIGYCFETNGVIASNTLPGSVQLTNEPVDISIYYANGQMALTFSNELSLNAFSTNLAVGDLTQILGTNTAYVGFTGGSGGVGAVQTISNFSFVSIPTAAIQANGPNALLSWPRSIVGYQLQTNSDLTIAKWGNIPALPKVTNNLNQIEVPMAGSQLFYRLHLP